MRAALSFRRFLTRRLPRSGFASWKVHLLLLAGLSFGLCAWGETVVFPQFTVAEAESYFQAQSLAFQTQAGVGAETYFVLARLQNRLGHQDEAERLARLALGSDNKSGSVHS